MCTYVIFFVMFVTSLKYSCCTEDIVELKPYYSSQPEAKLFCSLAGGTFCLNVTNYPSEQVHRLMQNMMATHALQHRIEDNQV